MKTKQRNKKLKYLIIALFLLVVTLISGRGILPAFADTTKYTGVLEDLQKDSSFNASLYPDRRTDYNIQVIQVAESVDGELYVYTYQPSQRTKPLTATCINMTLTDELTVTDESENSDNQGTGGSGGTVKPIPRSVSTLRSVQQARLYNLTLLDTVNVFCKYVVDGFTVSSDTVRYYNVTSIYREPVKSGITLLSGDNTVTEVACPVGKVWKATTTSDGVKYEMKQVETVTITDKYVGTARYPNGVKWFTSGKCDSHFVAFATNRQIDTLLEADVTYVTKTYDKKLSNVTYGEKITNYKSLSCDQTVSNKVMGLFGKKYTWNRILSVNEFSTTASLSQDQKNELNGKQWVLSFAETDYTQGTGGLTGLIGIGGVLIGSTFQSGTLVSEVSILRLKFITDGKTFNLGVVDNKQTGEGGTIPDPIPGLGGDDTNISFNFWAFLGDCFKQSFTGKGAWWQITVVVITVIVAITAVALVVSWLKWVGNKLFGKGRKQD